MTSSLAEEVELRAANDTDIGAISRVVNWPPEPPMATLLGSDRASRLGDLLVRAGVTIALTHTTVAVLNCAVVGVLDCGSENAERPSAARLLLGLPHMFAILGLALPRAFYGLWLRRRVQFEPMPDAFVVAELYVDEDLRNHGIGGRLLRHAEQLARRNGSSRMSVETGITNPARRLYERLGYQVVATKTDRGYERMTGSPGRVLMVKDLRS